eukprot:bmy_08988T0
MPTTEPSSTSPATDSTDLALICLCRTWVTKNSMRKKNAGKMKKKKYHSPTGLNCTVKNSTCLDDTWIHPRNLTPSSPKDVQTQLCFAHTQQGHLLPVVHIEWTLQTDDCEDPRMKITTPCVSSGSLWDPSITVETLEDHQLRLSFTPWNESTKYQILLDSFLPVENRSCFRRVMDLTVPAQEATRQCCNVTLTLPDFSWCCRHHVQIQPFFSSCLNDCLRHSVAVPCPEVPHTPDAVEDYMPLWVSRCIPGLSILLVGSVILLVVCMAWRLLGSHHGKYENGTRCTDVLPAATSLSPPPLKPRKVWIVYSADHPLYVDVVLKFAQFLLTVCGTEVALDLLEEQAISEAGVMTWVGRRKQEVVEGNSKIIVLCSRGTRAKWQAILGWEDATVQLRCDRGKPAGDLFTAAMNMILPDFKRPACFGTYIVCYFSDISCEADIPELFNITSCYALMDKFEEVYFRIQDLEMFGPGRMHRVGVLTAQNYLQSPGGQQLREAVQRFRRWQAQCPDWFKLENLCSADDQDLPSLDEEAFEEPPPGGGIVRQEPLVLEPASQGSLLVELLLAGEGGGPSRLEPQPWPQEQPAAQTLQTTVVPVDGAPPAQAVEPVPQAVRSGAASRLALAGGGEACPLLGGWGPGRNSLLFLPVHPEDPPVRSSPAGRLDGSVLPPLQQSPSCQDVRAPPGEEERRSVQSDQGYISRSSPQLPDDDDGDRGGGPGGQPLYPEGLESLRSLQLQLFLQELRKNPGLEPKGPPRGASPAQGGEHVCL